ncbi:hypothetical protein P20652_2833 [Pseudoalteromonas sp. BSi20652]|uniref:hypothetical protein n=1 Tax=Pseudoalteromonas sp. BSi20652 TaxID=388384 RepID=UPI0002316B02|nr:hypothetical protein [Pseudoalteromonas sp. BSi20652]GAA60961.1 hypothetical protein P20652_2833 [Pseudoalteromonas sp. BSi20652]
MRTPLLAILLPLCLTACLDKTPAETQQVTISSEAETSKQELQKLEENTQLKENTKNNVIAEKIPKADSKNVSIEDIKTAKAELNTLITDKQCDTSTQCRVIAVGSRACGGPSSFVVYSTNAASEEQVTILGEKITKLESNYNSQKGMMSICQHLTTPSTQCVENKCVKLEGSAASVF